MTRRLSGPRKLYRHVGSTAISTKLTPDGTRKLAATCDRTRLKRGDVFEYLLHHYADRIPDNLLEQQAAAEAAGRGK